MKKNKKKYPFQADDETCEGATLNWELPLENPQCADRFNVFYFEIGPADERIQGF